MNRVSPKAVLISLAAMLALDTVGSVVLTFLFTTRASQVNMAPQQTPAALDAMVQSNGFLLSAFAYGTITTILGGYLVARLAKGYPYFNAGVFGVACLALTVLLSGGSPLWFNAICFLVTLPAALYGGHLARRRALPGT
jgi:hypothetical protein